MKKITLLKSLFMAGFFLFGTFSASSQLLVENFDYTIGSLLTANGWTAHSGEGTQTVDVTDGLTFAGYAGSGIGGAARLDNTGEDVNKTFTAQTAGTIYTSFLLNTGATNSSGYFYMFAQNPASSNFIGRVFINATGNGIGISNSSTAPSTYISITPGVTVLVVVKYDFASQLSYLYVLNSFSATEPGTPDQTSASTGSLSGGVGSIALRQYNAAQRQIVDGIRVATTWADAVAPASSTPTVATPTFNPAAGTYTSTQNVSISTTTADASIYYTTNGDEPTELSTPYTAPVEISATTTLKAKAYKTGMDPSATATAEYTINVAPTISVTEVTIPAMSCTLDNNDTETINVSGTNLTSDIVLTIDGADAGMFSVTPSLSSTGGIATITYAPTSEGTHTATLRLNSAGATEVTKILNGKVVIPAVKGSVIITEVYGGGGNSGAILKNDFIELFNRTEESIDISGWSLQYYSSTGTGIATESNIFVIPEGKYIPAFRHFLIQAAAGAGGTDDLDKPDATCSLALSGTSGKVILYNTSEAQEIDKDNINSIIENPQLVDYVPYGTTAIPIWGSAMSSNTSNTTSASRILNIPTTAPQFMHKSPSLSEIYYYTGNIGMDFLVSPPNPLNSEKLISSINVLNKSLEIFTANGKVMFNATAGERVEIYNAVGQRVVNTLSTDELNSISLDAKGVLLVKVGERIGKVIM